MSVLRLMKPADVLIEIGQSSFKVVQDGLQREVALERSPNGTLTEACKERVAECLREFVGSGLSRPRAVCAIGARGVSLRRMKLPSSVSDNLDQMVGLQIESELPLPPDQLAWGYCSTQSDENLDAGNPRDLVVVAVKKEAVDSYAELISRCGLDPVFTLAALAGSAVCRTVSGTYGVLDVGRFHSELIVFEEGAPVAVRSLPWGGEDVTRALADKFGVSRDEAEQLKLQPMAAERRIAARDAVEGAVAQLAAHLGGLWAGEKLYLTGGGARVEGLPTQLGHLLKTQCELVKPEASSAALAGLQAQRNGAGARLVIRTGRIEPPREQRSGGRKWAILACLFVLALASLRYWEGLVRQPALARHIEEVKAGWRGQTEVDRELSFFQYLETNRPPYLESLAVVAQAAGGGTKIDSILLNRRGDLSVRGSMPSADQAAGFRNKLIESGRFGTVVLEEQTPTPNEQKVAVRISARGQTPPKGTNDIAGDTLKK